MPNINTFINSEFYYATLLHELAHSTGHLTRLNRDFSGKMNGSEEQLISYAKEELIAETTRSFLQVKLGLNSTNMELQNALYLKSWIKSLKNNPKILWSIFSEASKAYGYVLEQNQRKEVAA
jgi:antirestriction protein ArdC